MDRQWKILVLQRGWVVVGRFKNAGHLGQYREGEGCHVIRRWGTDQGLGQLVDGPRSQTILDACGEVRTHELTVVFEIACNQQAWSDWEQAQ